MSEKKLKKQYKRRRTSKPFKVTKIHIFAIMALLLAVFIALVVSLSYVYTNHRAISAATTVNASDTLNHSNITINTQNITDDIPYDNISNTTTVAVDEKPKLTIIIDDVINESQIKKISSIPLRITPSFLPPKRSAPNSPILAQKTEFYMVHLPLEALKFGAEPITLFVSDSYEEILAKLTKFKNEFPRAIYYNNHTGSKFTADLEAMQRLFRAMGELGLIFVDSRTTAHTKAPRVAKELGLELLQRDIFLDNDIEALAVKKQLNLAINRAKQKGFAIAIGHPHKETLEAINASLNELAEVNVVYLKDLQ